ncbi:cytochrome P450 [Halobacillus shinanisalinarum]|uniref:Cytochrome P450 n=1 Tax=Halobacillus shinanisalinarum TaxID=2932258 RepID=A0ABY4GTV4_9BACI|nr:cytochrome P450 [Halobacillus shinanisalinarum]UOQ91585.1 cytochrome P450 [Halobacillus shinanisalinarum]
MNKEVISLKEVKNFQTRSEEFFPLNWYEEMLNHTPVYFHEETDTWHVFKYEDVQQVLSNYEFFTTEGSRTAISVGANNKEGTAPDKVNLVSVDPPQHRKKRSLFAAAFTPRSLKNWEPRIQRIVTELVEDIQEDSTVDIVQALAGPLPSMVIAELFGVPLKDQSQFKHWVDILFQPYDEENEEEIEQRKQTAAKEYYQYLYPIVVQKRSNPSEDIISDLIRVEVDGETFTDDEIVRSSMLLLGAGVETTSHALANTFYSLLYDDPSLYEELRNDLDLVPNAVEEMLRYRFQISKRDRTVKQDNDLLGPDLKEGDVVVAWMSAANMDKDMFDDPFSLNIHRSNNKKHLTFGKGPHFCLGAPLARLELTFALKTFLQRFSRIEPVESFDLEKSLTESAPGQSLTHLPIKVYK